MKKRIEVKTEGEYLQARGFTDMDTISYYTEQGDVLHFVLFDNKSTRNLINYSVKVLVEIPLGDIVPIAGRREYLHNTCTLRHDTFFKITSWR